MPFASAYTPALGLRRLPIRAPRLEPSQPTTECSYKSALLSWWEGRSAGSSFWRASRGSPWNMTAPRSMA